MKRKLRSYLPGGRPLAAMLTPIVLLLFLACQSEPRRQGGETAPPAIERMVKDSLFLIVDQAAGDADTFDLSFDQEDSLTVLSVLRLVAAQERIAIETKEFPMGVLVEQIGQRVNGEGGFWLYTINSEPVPRAVSAHYPVSGDTVRFFYKLR